MRLFTWIDVPLLLVPGLVFAMAAFSWQESEAAQSMAVWALGTYGIFVAFYAATRLLAPRDARTVLVALSAGPAVLSFVAGELSMGAGYAIWAFVSAPLFGILFGAALKPRTHKPSPPVSA